ncbi:hypothetical protein EV07_0017 [Prochlorococcus sp. MIT 0603]|nr:hypothetical protein EV07_0017 [Prochlorococcus sp. MIT 0603]
MEPILFFDTKGTLINLITRSIRELQGLGRIAFHRKIIR